jgi:uncharacterized protein
MQAERQAKPSLKKSGFRYTGLGGTLAGVVGGLLLLSLVAEWGVTWLWMRQLGYESVFWRIRLTQLALFGAAFAAVVLYGGLNLHLLLRQAFRLLQAEAGRAVEASRPRQLPPNLGAIRATAAGLLILVGSGLGVILAAQWQTYFRFHWAQSFAQTEPVFQRDLGFYLFRLPFYELLQNSLVGLFGLGCAITLVVYLAIGARMTWQEQLRHLHRSALWHLGINVVLVLGALGWGYYLDRFHLLTSTRGVVYGAGYTDVHIVRLGLWVMVGASVVCGLGALSTLVRRQPRGLTRV